MEREATGKTYKMKGHTLPGINQRSEGNTDLADGRSKSSVFQQAFGQEPILPQAQAMQPGGGAELGIPPFPSKSAFQRGIGKYKGEGSYSQKPSAPKFLGSILGGGKKNGGGVGVTDVLTGGLSMLSDMRAKENIIKLGNSPSGIPIYKFNYIGQDNVCQGTMAQDLLSMGYSDAVSTHESGYYTVDYNMIDVDPII